MKRTILITLVISLAAIASFGQVNQSEQEILKIHASLDNAFIKKDLALFESIMAPEYTYSDPQGRTMDRAANIAEMKKEWANTNYRPISAATENAKVRVMGNTALVTSDWSFTGTATAPRSEEHTDRGRYTGVYEKQNGKWMLVAEHFSEAPHDRKLMEQQVMRAGLAYADMLKRQDGAAIEGILADDYLFTNSDGKVKTKAEDLADYKNKPAKFERFDISDQKVRIIGNSAAVETGTVSMKGVSSEGKPFEAMERYTTTWIWRSGRWQVVADHVSEIRK